MRRFDRGSVRAATGAVVLLVAAACATAPSDGAPGASGTSQTTPSRPSPVVATTQFVPDASLYLCPRVTVSNAPPSTSADRAISGYLPYVRVNNAVRLAVSPTNAACISSGFGIRSHRPHKGVDLQADPASVIRAAGDGVVREAGWHRDYGNYVLIDHGNGVYTRYAHLAGIANRIAAESKLSFGAELGVMSNTADYPLPVHLHYEVLTGDYNNPKGAFGLLPINIFDQAYVAR